jgi:hypothetical protein
MEHKNVLANRNDDDSAEAAEIVTPASADKVDRALVDRSVSHIREVMAKTVTRGLDEIGQYLLKEFFDDDPAFFLASSPTKHASLRKLMDRCDSLELPVSKTFLVNALRMAVVAKELPNAASFNRLPPSHRVELLRVRAPEKREQLASRAVASKLSVLKLRTLVQKQEVRDKASPGRGRTPSPSVLKSIEGCLRLLRDEDSGKLLFRRSDVAQMTDEQHALAEAALKALEKRVADLRRILS